MPVIDVSARAYTLGENEMTSTDAITVELKIKLTNLKENQYPGYVHSPNYPYLKKQSFWIIISDMVKDKTIMATKICFRN